MPRQWQRVGVSLMRPHSEPSGAGQTRGRISMAFEGFELSQIDLGEVRLRVRRGGAGPPLLLLHGYPETHMMWGRVAGELARDFTVVAPDLRGYGGSTLPATQEDHAQSSKRAMAQDAVALMGQLGFERFA